MNAATRRRVARSRQFRQFGPARAFNPNSEVGEHARPGRCWTRLPSSIFARNTVTNLGNIFVRPMFSAKARKIAPGAGALPFPFRSLGSTEWGKESILAGLWNLRSSVSICSSSFLASKSLRPPELFFLSFVRSAGRSRSTPIEASRVRRCRLGGQNQNKL